MTDHFQKRQLSAAAAQCEVMGLELLRQAAVGSGLEIPAARADGCTVTMPRIATARWGAAQWRRLGAGLAQLHRAQAPQFGLAEDNFIGRNPQPNGWWPRWGEFFLEQRLRFQLGLVQDPSLRRRWLAQLDRDGERLAAFLDTGCSGPSLLHGDLWHGNVLCDDEGRVWLIDPAVYYGDREADLAMTELFGGFDAAFYVGYDGVWPRSAAYARKRDIYNLYHCLNHYNLFGSSYRAGCEHGFELIAAL